MAGQLPRKTRAGAAGDGKQAAQSGAAVPAAEVEQFSAGSVGEMAAHQIRRYEAPEGLGAVVREVEGFDKAILAAYRNDIGPFSPEPESRKPRR